MINDKLYTLIVLAREKNYTKTAELRNITQPAVTQHIQSLENHFGIKIFIKKGKELVITPEGETLIKEARKLISIDKRIKEKLERELDEFKSIDIGITLTASNHIIPKMVQVFKDKFPNITYSVHTTNVKNIYEKLRFDEFEFAVIDGTPPTQEFESALLEKDELIFIASPNHPLAQKKEITLVDLKKEKMILRDKNANTRIVFENYLLNHFENIDEFDIILEIESTSLIKQLVIKGHGISIMSRVICERLIEQGVLTALNVKNFRLERGIYLIYPKQRENDTIIQSIIKL